MKRNLVAYDDAVLIGWLLESIEEPSSPFLSFLAEAAVLADAEEYAVLRPGLLLLKRKHLRVPLPASANTRGRASLNS